MNYDFFYNSLPLMISLIGLMSSVIVFIKVKKVAYDRALTILFIFLAILDLYIGAVYALYTTNYIDSVVTLSILMRPANLLQIAFPSLIMWRMGVIR